MDTLVQTVIDALRGLGPWPVYAMVLGLGFSSSAFALDLVLPGEVGLLLAGWIASEGRPTLLGVFLAGALGAAAGDSFSYWVGGGGVSRSSPVGDPSGEDSSRDPAREGLRAPSWPCGLRRTVGRRAEVGDGVRDRRRSHDFRAFRGLGNVAAWLAWSAAVSAIGYFLGRFFLAVFRQAALLISLGAVSLLAAWLVIRWIRSHPERVPQAIVRLTPAPRVAVAVGAAGIASAVAVLVLT